MTQAECKAKYLAAKADFLSVINDIDNETPWSRVEPAWWLEMSKFRSLLYAEEKKS